jgi:predicted GTPase
MSQQFAVAREQQNIRQRETGEDNTRLVIQIQNQCKFLKRLKENTFSYQLELNETTFDDATTIIKRFSFGKPNQLMDRPWKTLLLMGETGSGKTTMINAMINYVLGVNWEDDFRFMLIKEEVRGGTQAHSQTQGVTAYDLHYQNGFRIPFSLTIVDTPGFGDTRGIERDEEITATIKEFFEHRDGIQVQ